MTSCENRRFVMGLTLHEQVSTEVPHYVQNINMVSRALRRAFAYKRGRWPMIITYFCALYKASPIFEVDHQKSSKPNTCVISPGNHAFRYKFKSILAKPIKM